MLFQFVRGCRCRHWASLIVVMMAIVAPLRVISDSALAVAVNLSYQDDQAVKTPEFTIDLDADGFDLPAAVDPGWYLVTLTNNTEVDIVADLVMLPPDRTVEDLQRSVTSDSGGSTIPDWFEEATFAGGPWAKAGARGQTLVPLTTGTWYVLQVGNAKSPVAEFEVNDGPPPADPSPGQLVDVAMAPGTFTMPEEVTTGNKIWRVTNSDTLTHAFALVLLPGDISYDEMFTLLKTGKVPDDIKLDEAPIVGGIGLLSGGRTIWTVFDLNPGYYVALDYVPIKDGRTFAELGQFAMFLVKDPE